MGLRMSKSNVFLSILIGLLLAAILVIVVRADASVARTKVDRCPKAPEVLKTAAGAHERAKKGWNARTLEKNQKTISRVRTQARCAPTKQGRKYVREQIDRAKRKYRKAKIDDLYDRITASPGQARLAVLRQCESTNRYNDPSAPAGAYGMLQGWSLSGTYFVSDKRSKKWIKLTGDGPTSPPYMASPDEQDIRASLLYQHHGAGPWECPF